MKEVFTYMFKDNKFIQKAAIYYVFLLTGTFCTNYANILLKAGGKPVLYLVYLAGILLLLVPYGYVVSCVKALIEQKENYILPMFNIKNSFVISIKYILALSVLCLVFALIMAIVVFIIALIGSILNAKLLAIVLLNSVIISAILLLIFYSLALNWIFANTRAITSFLQVRKAHSLIKQDYPRYWKSLGLFLVVGLLSGATSLSITKTASDMNLFAVICVSLITSLIATYMAFVMSMVNAKSIGQVCKY